MNIKLSYLYRDGANYKQYNEEVYGNKDNLPIEHIRDTLKSYLIEGEWFFAKVWDLKDMHYYPYDDEIDHDYHEFGEVEETDEPVTKYDISILLQTLQNHPRFLWKSHLFI